CADLSPRAVLLAGDTYSQEIAPRLAYRLGGSAVGDGVEVRVEGETLRVSRQVYGGKAQAVIELKRMPAVVWLRARSFAPARARASTWPAFPRRRLSQRSTQTRTRRSSSTAVSASSRITVRSCRCCARSWPRYRNEHCRSHAADLLEHLPHLGDVPLASADGG